MKKHGNILSSFLVFFLVSFSPMTGAQTPPSCDSFPYEPRASTTRDVRLEQFGIEVTIPSNYRTMLLENGEVSIVDPATFKRMECNKQGGRRYRGGGFYYENIKSIPRHDQLSFEQQVFHLAEQNISNPKDVIQNFTLEDKTAYLIHPDHGFIATLMVLMPDQQNILVLIVGCDCPVEASDVIDLANRIRFIKN